MQRRSQTALAVLGALSTGPMTGYELRSTITEVLGHFWHESFGQIYPTLATLEAEGAVRRGSAGRTSGSVFALTDAGAERLRELLAEPPSSQPPRNGLLLRLFFGTHLPPGEATRLLQAAADRAQHALDDYASTRAAEPAADTDGRVDRDAVYRDITLAFGEQVARAQLSWALESIARIQALDAE